jgi:two-component system phosphate regulon sensor histidine kinase PhoR
MDRQQGIALTLAGVTVAAIAAALAAVADAPAALVAAIAFALGAGCALAVRRLQRSEGTPGTSKVPAEVTGPREDAGILAVLPLPLLILDRQLRVRFANPAADAMFGPVATGEPLSTAVRASALADAAAAARGGEARAVEFTHMRTREERLLLAHVQPVTAAADGPALMVLVEDHTRQARIEQMRRDFIANASHELKTPLASVAGFIETLMGPAADDPGAVRRFLPIMAAQAERMKRLVDDLTSLSRIEMNEHVRPTGTVDLDALLRETAAAMAPLAEAAGVAVEIDLPGAVPQVVGARDELGQLFANLIDNAIKHGGPPGPVTVALAPDEPGRRALVGVSVSDRGPGIAREHIPRLTERFYRVQGGARSAQGTGLGLSIVKHILNRHRGELVIRSIPGQGSTFTAWLPRAAGAPAGEHAAKKSVTSHQS